MAFQPNAYSSPDTGDLGREPFGQSPRWQFGMTFPANRGQNHNLDAALNIQAETMAYENTVLSLNPDGQTLRNQESALRESGFEVISVHSPIQARFEIEMGRCGIFLTTHITPLAIYCDLASLFRRNCPNGLVIFMKQHPEDQIPDAHILLSDRDEPQAVVKSIRSKQQMKAS